MAGGSGSMEGIEGVVAGSGGGSEQGIEGVVTGSGGGSEEGIEGVVTGSGGGSEEGIEGVVTGWGGGSEERTEGVCGTVVVDEEVPEPSESEEDGSGGVAEEGECDSANVTTSRPARKR